MSDTALLYICYGEGKRLLRQKGGRVAVLCATTISLLGAAVIGTSRSLSVEAIASTGTEEYLAL